MLSLLVDVWCATARSPWLADTDAPNSDRLNQHGSSLAGLYKESRSADLIPGRPGG
jgi:hypothetical protein